MQLNFDSIDELKAFVSILDTAFLQVGPTVINDLKIERVCGNPRPGNLIPDILSPGEGDGLPTDMCGPDPLPDGFAERTEQIVSEAAAADAMANTPTRRTRRTKAQIAEDNAKAQSPEPAVPEEEPATTETHTLPADEPEPEPAPTLVGLDDEALGQLIAAATDAAPNTSPAMLPLLSLGRDFITAHSVATLDAIKAACGVAGVPMQKLQPEQCQLLRAALELYRHD